MQARKQISFRGDDDLIQKIEELCQLTGIPSRQELITNLILSEYDRWKGNPQLLAIVEQMKQLENQLKDFDAVRKR